MIGQHVCQLKFISLLSGCSSLLTLAREILHGGVKTRLVGRNCNLVYERNSVTVKSRFPISTVIIFFNVSYK